MSELATGVDPNMQRVEYLVTIDQKDSFCASVAAFNNLIRSIDGISLSKSLLHFKDLSFEYEVQTGEISSDKQRFFHVKLTSPDAANYDVFETLLKSVRTVLTKASGRPVQTLWDDLSFQYARSAYPLIYELENLLRKLITKFMLRPSTKLLAGNRFGATSSLGSNRRRTGSYLRY